MITDRDRAIARAYKEINFSHSLGEQIESPKCRPDSKKKIVVPKDKRSVATEAEQNYPKPVNKKSNQ